MEFYIQLDWGKMHGPATKTNELGPYPTRAMAEKAAANFSEWYSACGGFAVVIEK